MQCVITVVTSVKRAAEKTISNNFSKMKKVIAIGQSVLDIVHLDGKPVASYTGGRIANMASSLGRCGIHVEYVSECANDKIGDMVVDFLKSNNVGTGSIDRFTDGKSQVSLIFRDLNGKEDYAEYVSYPDTRFNVLWPRIEEGDIVVFGSYFAIDSKPRKGLLELLNYARERKAVIVYLPGFHKELCTRITRVMPEILENLEYADFVIARQADMEIIFDKSDALASYSEHIKFYCPNFVFTDSNNGMQIFSSSTCKVLEFADCPPQNRLGKDAAVAAGIVYGMLKENVNLDTVNSIPALAWEGIARCGVEFANECIKSGQNIVSKEFANNK